MMSIDEANRKIRRAQNPDEGVEGRMPQLDDTVKVVGGGIAARAGPPKMGKDRLMLPPLGARGSGWSLDSLNEQEEEEDTLERKKRFNPFTFFKKKDPFAHKPVIPVG